MRRAQVISAAVFRERTLVYERGVRAAWETQVVVSLVTLVFFFSASPVCLDPGKRCP